MGIPVHLFGALALGIALLSAPAKADAPPILPPPTFAPGWMFNPSVVVDVDLVIPPSSLERMPTHMEAERPYVPATFTMTYSQAGRIQRTYGPWAVTLKVKGMYGSFRNLQAGEKAALKIKFPSGKRPDGLKKFTLNNMVQDASMVREVLAYEVFRSMGVAAPRAGYARVTINGDYFGTYLNLETIDDVALPRWFDSTGHLYEGSYGSWWGDVADPFSGHYEVDEGDSDNRMDLARLIAAANSPAGGWLARMHPVADLEQMSLMWACEWFTGHWDGYSQFITNNYYLHANAAGRFTMMPWGTDQTFTWAERFNTSPDHFIFNNAVRDPVGRALYTDALHAVGDKWLTLGLESLAEIAHASASPESAGIEDVRWFIRERLAEHLAWAATLPPAPSGFKASVDSTRPIPQVELTWDRPRPSRWTPAIREYVVEWRSGDGPWTRVRAINRNRLTLEKLPPGACEIRVRAAGKAGDSLPTSLSVTVPPPRKFTPRGTPR